MEYCEEIVFATGGRSHFRIPSMIAAKDGTMLAFCNDRKDTVNDHAEETAISFSRKPLSGAWEAVTELASIPGWTCSIGAAVYDENAGKAFCFGRRIPVATHEFRKLSDAERAQVEARTLERICASGISAGDFILESPDQGISWIDRPLEIEPFDFVREDGMVVPLRGFCHGSAHGITLRHGEHKGRLLCPSRVAVDEYHDFIEIRRASYNNALYSDDHGQTWKASAPVQAGTGEGALMEDDQGVITYNSRAYYADQKRYLATSTDGGQTYSDFRCDDFLLEEKAIGCNASLLRVERNELGDDSSLLPETADSVTVFINPRAEDRTKLTACVSFDNGKTWSHTRLIHPGRCAYSSLAYNALEKRFYLLYEKGVNDPYDIGIASACFDLEWLLAS